MPSGEARRMDVRAKVAAITGAGSGIGRALAVAMAREGALLALADRDADGLAETVRLVSGAGATASTHVVDVSDEAAVNAFAVDAVTEHGRVDVLVNNAGVALYGSVLELSTSEIAWLMNVNFWGVVHGVKAFLPGLLRRPEAAIVNLSSLFGLWGPPGQSAYAASKFAVRGFSESLRAELAGTGVHVVTVHPAGIRTAIARSSRIAAAADPAAAEAATRFFDRRFLVIPPETAAAAILRGIEKRRDRVLIGRDALRVDVLTRLLGPRASRLFNRRATRGSRA
jgi:short-subunit dehydrogenase